MEVHEPELTRVRKRGIPNLGCEPVQDGSSGLSHGIEVRGEKLFVALVKLDVVRTGGSGIETDGLGNDEGNGFGLEFAGLLGRPGASVAVVKDLVCEFMDESREFVGWFEALFENDGASLRDSECSAELVGVFEFDVHLANEVFESVAVFAGFSLNLSEFWKRFSVGLVDVEHIDDAKSEDAVLIFFGW